VPPRSCRSSASGIPGRYGLDPIRDIQVLCPMNRGGLGARSLNIDLRQALNSPGEVRVERFGSAYGMGDKVMQVEDDYDKEVYNGDLGVVRAIDPEASEMVIEFDGRLVTYSFGELDAVVLATIHNSQGSAYPAVVIPLTTQHYTMRSATTSWLVLSIRICARGARPSASSGSVTSNGTARSWHRC
jgi:exodeoxyribonuclease V alpha subunit